MREEVNMQMNSAARLCIKTVLCICRLCLQVQKFYEIGFIKHTTQLITNYAQFGLELASSDDGAQRARAEKLRLRTLMAAEDAKPLLKKYNITQRFNNATS